MVNYNGLREFDPARYLESEDAIQVYLEEARWSGDEAFQADALEVASRARRMISEKASKSATHMQELQLA